MNDIYQSPLAQRYASKEMQQLFSNDKKFRTWRRLWIALAQSDSFLCYTAIGITALFAIQVMINLGVVVGLFPVTGITLPFISYGGSSLVVMMASMGLLISIANSAAQE